MQWMAWTVPTAIFFGFIGISLIVMTLIELKRPTTPARGWLPINTTRGDRFFISLLSAAYVHLAWLAAVDGFLLGASLVSVALAVFIMRWG